MGCGVCQKCTNTTCVYAMPTDDMRLCHTNWQHAYANLYAQYIDVYHPAKCINQHAIYQCNMPACGMSMQTCTLPACSLLMQTCKIPACNMSTSSMLMQTCKCVNATLIMPACSMSTYIQHAVCQHTYSMQWLKTYVYQHAVCWRARCKCTDLITCIHIGEGTSIYLGGPPQTPLHTWQLFWFKYKPLQI